VEGEAEVDVVRTKRRDWALAAARQDAAAAIRGSGNFVADDFRIWRRNKTEPSDSGFHRLALLKSAETGMTA